MKKLLKILLGIVAAFVLLVIAVFYFTADMVSTADNFFAAVKQRDMHKAYTYLSEDFKASTSEAELDAYLQSNQLADVKQANWESRSVNGGRGTLIGSVTTENGGVVPISFEFVKGESGWKIYAIQKPSAGIAQESTTAQMPDEAELVKLVHTSMLVFAESVNEKSMAKMHSHVSNLWQQQFTIERFNESFQVFFDLGVDLTVLKNYSPQFTTTPMIDENGILEITGLYPTQPNQVHFTQKYIYEGLGWKLMGFKAQIK